MAASINHPHPLSTLTDVEVRVVNTWEGKAKGVGALHSYWLLFCFQVMFITKEWSADSGVGTAIPKCSNEYF